jgi:SulP family sulfate permease
MGMVQQTNQQANLKKPKHRLLPEFGRGRLLPALVAGLICAVLTIIVEVSFAAMIFSGKLSGYLPAGIGFLLFGAIVLNLVVSLTSSFPGTVAIPQDTTSAILAGTAVAIVAGLPVSASAEVAFFSLMIAIALSSLLTGAFLFVLGYFKLGNLIRFVPYPVIGGFLAGAGWLLVVGGIKLMIGISFDFSQIPRLFHYAVVVKWLPGVILAIVLLVSMRRYRHFLIMPVFLMGAIGLFYLLLLLTNTSIAEARAEGWLLGTFSGGVMWQPLPLSLLTEMNWPVILGQVGDMGALMVITVISLLLAASGIEYATHRDLDLNRELTATGLANILASFGGGAVGYHVLSQTALAHKMAPQNRLVGVSSAGFCGVALVWGASCLSFFPTPVLGGLIVFLGLSFLIEWTYDAWFRLPQSDYFLIILILVVVGAFGFLEGVVTGITVAVVLFVLNYSKINVIKHGLSGTNFQSNVDRSASQAKVLQKRGEQIYILKLQGFIFFGTAYRLLTQVRHRAQDPNLLPLRFVIFDFRLVTGLDSSALYSFSRLKQLSEEEDITLIFTQLLPELGRQFELTGYMEQMNITFLTFHDLDHAVEWCEDQLVRERDRLSGEKKLTLPDELKILLPELTHVDRLMGYFEKQEVAKGHYLMRQGDPPKGLYLVDSGQVTAQLELADGEIVRLRKMPIGTVIGELGLYMGSHASASVVANRPTNVYYLSVDKLKEMEAANPEMAAIFHKFIVRILCLRLAKTNNTIRALLA